MKEYVLIYSGGRVPQTETEQDAVVQAWGRWFRELGDKIVDGGNPFSPNAKSINPDGSVTSLPSETKATGYAIIKAESLYSAAAMAQKCPVLLAGAKIQVYETFKAS